MGVPRCCVKKVEYKKGHTVGEQECSLSIKRHRYKVVVAKFMKIMEERGKR